MRHTFTHFHLILTVLAATTDALPLRGAFVAPAQFRPAGLPTLMRKAWDLATAAPRPS